MQQLEQAEIPRRLAHHPFQDLEELLAAGRFAMECHEQRAPCPAALRAPRRVQHRLVEHGAQNVTRGDRVVCRHCRLTQALLECAHFRIELQTKCFDVWVCDLRPQPPCKHEQRCCRGHQCIRTTNERNIRGFALDASGRRATRSRGNDCVGAGIDAGPAGIASR